MKVERELLLPAGFTLKRTLDFVSTANLFQSHIFFNSKGYLLNCKGVLGMVSFCLQFHKGGTVLLIIDGPDAEETYQKLENFLVDLSSDTKSTFRKAQ